MTVVSACRAETTLASYSHDLKDSRKHGPAWSPRMRAIRELSVFARAPFGALSVNREDHVRGHSVAHVSADDRARRTGTASEGLHKSQ
jgi:hypothetical protein